MCTALELLVHALGAPTRRQRCRLLSLARLACFVDPGWGSTLTLLVDSTSRRLQDRALRQLQADLSNIDRGMASARSDSSVPPATLRRLEKSFTALQTLIAKLGHRIGVATRSSQPAAAAPAQQAQATKQQEVVIELQGWGQADQAILEERSVAATQIVRETQELKEAFDDLAVLVQEQSEALDQMEANTGATVTAVQAGNAHLEEAHEMQKGTRKRMCIILLLAVVVLGVIVGSVVVTSVQ